MGRRLKPIREVELENKNIKLRVILLVVCLVIAVVSLGVGVSLLLNKQDGWQTVEASSGVINCSEDFSLQYCFGQGEMSATEEYRSVSSLYSRACEEGYQFFHSQGELAKINAAPNQPVSVPPALYRALELIRSLDSRYVYLAPVYVEYNRVILCENEVEASLYDPNRDPEQAQWIGELAAYCADPAMIDLELLGENTVRLNVSEEYLSFARAYEITEFLDLGWMCNAFVADHIADTLAEAGFTRGYLASYDGFTRNLDSDSYNLNIFHRKSGQIDLPGVITYKGPASVVCLRDYPMGDVDKWHYFVFSDGSIVTAMADPADGRNKSALRELTAYSHTESCAEIALRIAPIYIRDSFSQEALTALTAEGIDAVWCTDTTIFHTQKDLPVKLTEDASYSISCVAP